MVRIHVRLPNHFIMITLISILFSGLYLFMLAKLNLGKDVNDFYIGLLSAIVVYLIF